MKIHCLRSSSASCFGRYTGATPEAFIDVLCPILIPIHSIDKTIFKVPGQNHYRASFAHDANILTSISTGSQIVSTDGKKETKKAFLANRGVCNTYIVPEHLLVHEIRLEQESEHRWVDFLAFENGESGGADCAIRMQGNNCYCPTFWPDSRY